MKAYTGMEVQIHSFFTKALDGYEWSTSSRPDRFIPGKEHRGPLKMWLDGSADRVWAVWE